MGYGHLLLLWEPFAALLSRSARAPRPDLTADSASLNGPASDPLPLLGAVGDPAADSFFAPATTEAAMTNRRPPAIAAAILCLAAIAAGGCHDAPVPAPDQLVRNPVPPPEVPSANLPEPMRPHNWVDAGGSGSCANASTVYSLRWEGMPEKADWWRNNHAGGETATSLRRKHDAAGLAYVYTEAADPSFLEWCTRTRRPAVIWFFTSHAINFAGFHKGADGQTYAHLCDNNRPSRFITIEKSEFVRRWKGYGGFGLAILASPAPPPLYPAFRKKHDA